MGICGSTQNIHSNSIGENPNYLNEDYIKTVKSHNNNNNQQRNRILLKVILLGDSGVGKSSIMNQYVHGQFIGEYKATIGADFLTKHVTIGEQGITLQIWDTAGQERFQSLGVAFYRGADCCALVFDVNDEKTFESIPTWREEFLSKAGISDPKSFPFILLGNKTDIENKREVSKKQALKWCEENGNISYFEVSAKEGTGIIDAFSCLAKTVIEKQSN